MDTILLFVHKIKPFIFKTKTEGVIPPVDLYWFFEISIRTEKKNQLELKKNFSYKLTEIFFQCSLKFFFSSRLRTEKKFQ